MAIVQEKRGVKKVNPNVLLIYSPPKTGKTMIASLLEDSYIMELEPGGADYVEGRIDEIKTPGEFELRIKEFFDEEGKIAKYLVIDTLTTLDEWSELVGTYEYMNKPQGKNFNRTSDSKKSVIIHTDKRFESVHVLPNGSGYAYSRAVMKRWLNDFLKLIKEGKFGHIILLAHIKDKFIESKTGDTVEAIEINLTGKVKFVYAANVSAVAYMYREGKENVLSFNNDLNNVIAGGRCPHLEGNIVISKKEENGKITTYWDKIFLPSK